MATRGRKPKPAEIKKIEGNPGKRDIPKTISTGKAFPRRPKWITGYAKEEWEFIKEIYGPVGVIQVQDKNILCGYCQSYKRWREAEEFIEENGQMIKAPSGYLQQLPQVAIANQQKRSMLDFAERLGIGPSARSRISATIKEEKIDPMEQLLNE